MSECGVVCVCVFVCLCHVSRSWLRILLLLLWYAVVCTRGLAGGKHVRALCCMIVVGVGVGGVGVT